MKRRSGASSKRPELVFFLDRSLGKHKVAAALRKAGAHVEIHDDHFPPSAKDSEWLPVVGKRGWVVLTKDDRIRYRQHEREALLDAGVRAFVLTNRNLTGGEMAAVFVDALRKIERLASKEGTGFIATVTRTTVRVVSKKPMRKQNKPE